LNRAKNVQVYGDEAYDAVAVVTDRLTATTNGQPISLLEKFVCTRGAVLNNVVDNVWNLLRKQHSSLMWTADRDDEQRAWFYDKCDGSVTVDGKTVFWYGVQDFDVLKQCIAQVTGATKSPNNNNTAAKVPSGKRSYSTTSGSKKRVGLIGARGYTGQELINLIGRHPRMELAYISSRELSGQTLQVPGAGYSVTYSNLSPEETAAKADVDCWVLALPNGVCAPWADAVQKKSGNKAVMVDLSADYRFTSSWTYGLPELYKGTRDKLRKSKLISNPGIIHRSVNFIL
jgi:N-acetyl-gamma-glutamyl-phosphate reductase/acetylglutamate kinase